MEHEDLTPNLDEPVAQPVATPEPSLPALARSAYRALVVAVAVLALLTVGVVTGMVSMISQMRDISTQMAATTSALNDIASRPVETVAANPNPSPSPSAAVAPAVDLTGVTLPNGMNASGAVLIGNPDASQVVESFVDFQCPFCQKWEQSIGENLSTSAVKEGSDLLVKLYPMAFLGESSPNLDPPGASARAANAALCMLDTGGQDAYLKMSKAIFASADPSEPPGQFENKVLVKMAKEQGASDVAVKCINDGTFVPAVSALTQSSFSRGVQGTPTVTLNGSQLQNPGDPVLADLASGGPAPSATPAP